MSRHPHPIPMLRDPSNSLRCPPGAQLRLHHHPTESLDPVGLLLHRQYVPIRMDARTIRSTFLQGSSIPAGGNERNEQRAGPATAPRGKQTGVHGSVIRY